MQNIAKKHVTRICKSFKDKVTIYKLKHPWLIKQQFGLVNLFIGILTTNGLFKTEIKFIYQCFIIKTIYLYIPLYFLYFIGNKFDKRSSSSCRTASTDLPDPLSPPVSIHHSWEVFKAISCISTELLYIVSN